MRRISLALVLILGAAATTRGGDLPRREKGDVAIRSRAILKKYCGECHSGTGDLFSVSDYRQLVRKDRPAPFINLDDPRGRSQLIEFVEDGSMPPGGRPRPSADEVAILKNWVTARAPSFPPAFDDRYTFAAMLGDWNTQPPDTRPHLRYLSFAHLVRDDRPPPDLKRAEAELRRALQAGSGKRVTPEPVDDTATVFRLDLRQLGWDAPDLFDRVEKGKRSPDAYPIVPFDLLLLDYPYSVSVPPNDPLAGRLNPFLTTSRQLRPVPFLRADWVAEAVAPGRPLASDLKSLVDLADAIREDKPEPCGPPVRPFGEVKASVTDGSNPVPPVTARYAADVSSNPVPFTLTADVAHLDGIPVTAVKVGERFMLKVKASRDARFVLLGVLADGDIRVHRGADTLLRAGQERSLLTGSGGPFVIGSILGGGDTATEYFILLAAEAEVPVPTLVRSRHKDPLDCKTNGGAPVRRFVFDKQPAGFDQSRVVRKVLSITVTSK